MWDEIFATWNFQNSHGGVLKLNARLLIRHIVKDIFLLLEVPHLSNVVSFDVSGCISLDASTIVECLNLLPNLMFFICRGCKNFSQYQLADIVKKSPNLHYFDATYGMPVSYVNAYVMLASSKYIDKFAVEPAHETYCKQEWNKLMSVFRNVQFGRCVYSFLEK